MSEQVILRTINLSKQFKKRWAVNNLNLEVNKGDVFGFLGPNGAGKSTTIRIIFSLIKPTNGDVEIFGHSIRKEHNKALQKVAGVVEKPDFYLNLSAYHNMQIAGSLTLGKSPLKKNIESKLELVGLSERIYDRVKTFSHGMKQRLGIAQALLCEPELIVLDEPTNGLDPHGMKEIRELITKLSIETGATIFLSSHLLHEVQQVATRMAIIDKGELKVQGKVKDLIKETNLIHIFKVKPINKAFGVLKNLRLVKNIKLIGSQIEVSTSHKNIPYLIQLLVKNNCSVFSVTQKNSLEDYFLKITSQDK
ncbi:MAG: ABC transporter ATP-binding protein [Bacteroidetes bacterium]|nr:ABC transporter ATP-binding protein [Bacteroidota bacterium]